MVVSCAIKFFQFPIPVCDLSANQINAQPKYGTTKYELKGEYTYETTFRFFSKRFVLVFSFHVVTFNMERHFKLFTKHPLIFLAKLGPIKVSLGRVVKKIN